MPLRNDTDIILKGTDGGADTTFLTIDGSAAGEATFNAGIVIANDGNIGSASDKDAIAIASNGVVTFSQIPVMPANSIDSDEYIDGSIDREHLAADIVDGTKIADNAINSEHYTDGSIDTAHIGDSQVTAAKLAQNSVDSSELIDGSIDTSHLSADCITEAKIADNALQSEHYQDGSIDTAHLADSQITVGKMAANSVDTDQYVDGSIDTVHIADNQITLAKMAGGTDGNLITYDASGDPAYVATGSDGQVLTSTGAGSAPAFEALPAGGKVLQVINQVQATEVTTGGDTYADTGLSLNITPSASNSKILFFASNDCTKHGGDTSVAIRAYRDSTEIGGTIIGRRICDTDDTGKSQSVFSFTILDSPNSTSQLTYKTQYNNTYAAGTVRINAGSGSSSMTLMEIGA